MRFIIILLLLFTISCHKDERFIPVNEKIVDKILKQEKDTLINVTVAPLKKEEFKNLEYYNEIEKYNVVGYFINTSEITHQKRDDKDYPNCSMKLAMFYLNSNKNRAVILTENSCSPSKNKEESLLSGYSNVKKCYFIRKIFGFWFVEKSFKNSLAS